METEVLVVGGGVIGLTTALTLAEQGRSVRIWAREPAARTTSAVAGAVWWPYRIEPRELVAGWSVESLHVYCELASRPEETGVRLSDGFMAGTGLSELGDWASELPAARATDATDPRGPGLAVRLPLIDMPAYLSWLTDRFTAAGGRIEEREIGNLSEATAVAPVVVNCTGLGSRHLVPDPAVRPVRGQLVLVENPGIDTWYVAADSHSATATYFFPQPGRLVLGGTAQDGDWSPEPDPATAAEIVRRCAGIRPEIAGARVLGHRVGLRPARDAVRIEAVRTDSGSLLVHHYGHGGAGVTVAWGCAREAARLVGRG